MKFGSNIMGVRLRHFADVAQAYEDCGFESIWVPEHLVFPVETPTNYPFDVNGEPPFTADTPAYDAWVLLASIAASTQRIRLGTAVYIMPLRHPLQTARSVVTLDRVSGGRVILGAGVGWLEDEFKAVGVPFAERGRRTDAAIDIVRRLWSEDVIEVHDEYYDFGPVKFQPKPLQKPTIPIEVGGVSVAALRRAGRRGDGWIEVGSRTVDEFRRKLDVVLEARAEAGRVGPFDVTVSGDLAHDATYYDALESAGATRLLVDARAEFGPRLDLATVIDWATKFAASHIDAP